MAQTQMRFDLPVLINADLCIEGCRVCVEMCPLDALAIDPQSRKAYMARDECWYCTPCQVDCPANAVTVKIPYLIR